MFGLFRRGDSARRVRGSSGSGGRKSPPLPSDAVGKEDAASIFEAATRGDRLSRARTSSGDRFFGTLKLSPNGGLCECGNLFDTRRYLGMTAFLAVLLLNTYNLLKQGKLAIEGRNATPQTEWLFHEVWLNGLIPSVPMGPDRVFAIFEIVMLIYYLHLLAYNVLVVATARGHGAQGFRRWDGVARIFFLVLPTLQSFSAMRVLQYVTPSMFMQNFKRLTSRMKELQHDKTFWLRRTTMLPCFLLRHLLFFLVGLEAFLVKFRFVARCLGDVNHQGKALFQAVLFLNQMLGVVNVDLFAKRRIFQFIFGGVDNYISLKETSRLRAWKAAFYRSVWMASGGKLERFLSVALTFSDVDFQQLVLDDDENA